MSADIITNCHRRLHVQNEKMMRDRAQNLNEHGVKRLREPLLLLRHFKIVQRTESARAFSINKLTLQRHGRR